MGVCGCCSPSGSAKKKNTSKVHKKCKNPPKTLFPKTQMVDGERGGGEGAGLWGEKGGQKSCRSSLRRETWKRYERERVLSALSLYFALTDPAVVQTAV